MDNAPASALLDLTILNAERKSAEYEDVFMEGMRRGIPVEVMTRLKEVWNHTKVIADEAIAVGKIVVLEIIEFMKAHPALSIGLALGAAVGALVASIPFLGPLLGGLSTVVSSLYGAGLGATVDAGHPSSDPFVVVSQLATSFFALLISVFTAIRQYWQA